MKCNCTECGVILNGFVSVTGACHECTIRRSRANEEFWCDLVPDDYDIEILSDKEYVNPLVNVKVRNVV